jgi:hypothetical protein
LCNVLFTGAAGSAICSCFGAVTTCTLRPETGHMPPLAGIIACCSVKHNFLAVPSTFTMASNHFG